MGGRYGHIVRVEMEGYCYDECEEDICTVIEDILRDSGWSLICCGFLAVSLVDSHIGSKVSNQILNRASRKPQMYILLMKMA
jgi:hypothetical protein